MLRILGLMLTAVASLECGGSVTTGNVGGGPSAASGAGGVGGEGGRAMPSGVGGGAGTSGVGGGAGTNGAGEDAGTNDAGVPRTPCQELLAHDPSGLYYASCLPRDLPAPFAFAVAQKVIPSADISAIQLELTPLKTTATTLADTSGGAYVLPPTALGTDCTFKTKGDPLTLPADANSLGRALVVENVVLRGKLESIDRSCSELDGMISLIMLSLNGDGDICVMIRTRVTDALPLVSGADYVCDPSILPPRMSGALSVAKASQRNPVTRAPSSSSTDPKQRGARIESRFMPIADNVQRRPMPAPSGRSSSASYGREQGPRGPLTLDVCR
jgi:hypothetical protein